MGQIKKIYNSLHKNYRNLYWWRDNILYYTLKLFDNNDGVYICNEEWDSLIILDCCRYDKFKEIYEKRKMKGNLECKSSRGTWTVEFLKENFNIKDYFDDIIYVTSNPYVDKYLNNKFYKIISVWKFGWDNFYNTVLPSEVYKYSIKIINKYPDKRIIIHFMQPHHPYITLNFKEDDLVDKIRKHVLYNIDVEKETSKSLTNIYSVKLYSIYDIRKIERAYMDNLEIVIPYVEALLNKLPGITIVTSDHGESFGDRIHPLIPIRFYGHGFTRLSSLIKVPWLIVDEKYKDPFYRDPKLLKREISIIKRKLRILKRQHEKKKIKHVIKDLKMGGKL